MGWLATILRALGPIAAEHGGQVLRESLKARAQRQGQAQPPNGPDPVEQLAADVDQLKLYAAQLKSDVEALNQATAAREERLRKWLLALLIWNAAMTLGLVLLAIFALRH